MDREKNIPKIFLDKVKWINDCPVWQGSLNLGNPHLVVKRVHLNVIWEVYDYFNGKLADRRKYRLEKTCENPLCIDPEHRVLVSKKMTDNEYRLFLVEKMLKKSTLLPDGCRVWNGTKDPRGYGQVHARKKCFYTHCLWYDLNNPDTKKDNSLQILHNCSNKSCFIHVRKGTAQENAEDKIRDGTLIKGSECHNASISEDTVQKIYKLAKKPHGKYAAEVTEKFKTTKSVVLKIWDHVNWCHVTCPEKVNENKDKRRLKEQLNKSRVATKEDYKEAIKRLVKTCTENQEGCMISTLSKDAKGYTTISFLGRSRFAHVIVAEFYYNNCKRIEKGFEVGHSCKNKCVGKDHLEICTHSKNMRDNYTEEQKDFVRKALESQGKGTIKERAKNLGVSTSVLSEFDRGITFSSLSGIIKTEKETVVKLSVKRNLVSNGKELNSSKEEPEIDEQEEEEKRKNVKRRRTK